MRVNRINGSELVLIIVCIFAIYLFIEFKISQVNANTFNPVFVEDGFRNGESRH